MSTPSDRQTSLGLSAVIVSLGTLSSRILGLIRDISIAFVFGAGWITDVFFIAYQVPSMFRKLLAEGALSSAVVPVYTDLENNRDRQAADRLARAAFTWTILLVGGLVLLGILFSRYLIFVVAPGFTGTEYFPLTVSLTRVMFPFLLMMSAAAVIMGVLHARKQFAVPAFAPALFNVSLICSIFFLVPRLGASHREQVWALAVGVLVGGFLQFFVQWLRLRYSGMSLGWLADRSVEGLKRILKLIGPMAFGLAISQMIVLVDKIVASFLQAGNISHLYYSNRLFQFPFALVGIAVGTVVLPESSEHVSQEASEEVLTTARDSLGMMSFLMLPAMVGLWLIGFPLLGLLFRRGEFTRVDQRLTFAVLAFALLGLFAYGCIRIFVSLCYSFEDTRGPVLGAAVALLINGVLDVLFVRLWPSLRYRVCGLTLAGSIAVWVQVGILRYWLARHLPAGTVFPWWKIGKHLLLAGLMGLVLTPVVFAGYSELVTVSLAVSLGVAFYFLLAHFSGETYPYRVLVRLKNKLREG